MCDAQHGDGHASHAIPTALSSREYRAAAAGSAGVIASGATAALTLEIPALRVGDKKIAKRLDARDGLEFFRIDEVGVERDGIAVGKKLHEAAVTFDQVI